MFSRIYSTRHNVLGYLFWSWVLRKNGKFTSFLDSMFFGPSRGMNDYDQLAASYQKSNVKPDKQYSILPTVLTMIGACTGKVVTDIGCGTGFFTLPIAESGASRVYGIDNSQAQLELAYRVSRHPTIRYARADAFVDYLPTSDIVLAPFVANYARTIPILQHFFKQVYGCLKQEGKIVLVVDLPNGKSLERFGATKTFVRSPADEAEIRIDLFKERSKICSLTAVYFTPLTIERLLTETGFRNIRWHRPTVSEDGISALGPEFWNHYCDDPELGYLTAEK